MFHGSISKEKGKEKEIFDNKLTSAYNEYNDSRRTETAYAASGFG